MTSAQWVQNGRWRGSLLADNSHVQGQGGFSGTFLPSNLTQVAAFSGLIGSYGSMGPRGHVIHLALVMGSMPGAQWVLNGDGCGSLLVQNPHV